MYIGVFPAIIRRNRLVERWQIIRGGSIRLKVKGLFYDLVGVGLAKVRHLHPGIINSRLIGVLVAVKWELYHSAPGLKAFFNPSGLWRMGPAPT